MESIIRDGRSINQIMMGVIDVITIILIDFLNIFNVHHYISFPNY